MSHNNFEGKGLRRSIRYCLFLILWATTNDIDWQCVNCSVTKYFLMHTRASVSCVGMLSLNNFLGPYEAYLPGTGWTSITKEVGPARGLSIALRLGWPLRSPQMRVTRVRNFLVGGTAFALSPETISNGKPWKNSFIIYFMIVKRE